jgi:hypothetical protein
LKGEVLYPVINSSPPEKHFGLTHTENEATCVIHLANPTLVDAEWKLVHVPCITSGSRNASFVDDPEVFRFDVRYGKLFGPTLPLEDAGLKPPQGFSAKKVEEKVLPQCIHVTFKPSKAANFRSRFRFAVSGGEGSDIYLTGEGTYEEIDARM